MADFTFKDNRLETHFALHFAAQVEIAFGSRDELTLLGEMTSHDSV